MADLFNMRHLNSRKKTDTLRRDEGSVLCPLKCSTFYMCSIVSNTEISSLFTTHWSCRCVCTCSGAKLCPALRPHWLQLARLPCTRHFPGKTTGVEIPSSRGSSQPRNWTHISYVSCIGRQILYHCCTWEADDVGESAIETVGHSTIWISWLSGVEGDLFRNAFTFSAYIKLLSGKKSQSHGPLATRDQ